MACVGCYPDPVAKGPVGPGGTLSLPDCAEGVSPAVPAGIFFQGASVNPIGLCGTTLSPSASKAILVDPGGMFPSSDLAVTWDSAIPAESAGMRVPVGPTLTLGMLPHV